MREGTLDVIGDRAQTRRNLLIHGIGVRQFDVKLFQRFEELLPVHTIERIVRTGKQQVIPLKQLATEDTENTVSDEGK